MFSSSDQNFFCAEQSTADRRQHMSAIVPHFPGVQDAVEQQLKNAFLAKIISQDEYDKQLRTHRGETGVVHLPTRRYGGTMVASTAGLWRYATGPYADKAYATGPYADKAAAWSSKKLVQHGNWTWNQTGDRKLNRCNAHTDCPVLMRVAGEDEFFLEVLDVAHSLHAKDHVRKNSAFTLSQDRSIQERTEAGKKPASMMRLDALDLVKANPYHPKLDGGGLEGEHDTMRNALNQFEYYNVAYRNISLYFGNITQETATISYAYCLYQILNDYITCLPIATYRNISLYVGNITQETATTSYAYCLY